MHKYTFLKIFEQTLDKILLLGTEDSFCTLATLVYYFHSKSKTCSNTEQILPQMVTVYTRL